MSEILECKIENVKCSPNNFWINVNNCFFKSKSKNSEFFPYRNLRVQLKDKYFATENESIG